MKKILSILIFTFGLAYGQSFRNGTMVYTFANDTITITFSDSPSKYVYHVDSAIHYNINKKNIYTFYVHQGKVVSSWTFEVDGMWSKDNPHIKEYGMYEPDFDHAMLYALGEVHQWQESFPPYNYRDTIYYPYQIREK